MSTFFIIKIVIEKFTTGFLYYNTYIYIIGIFDIRMRNNVIPLYIITISVNAYILSVE